jgi:hypothetical protein
MLDEMKIGKNKEIKDSSNHRWSMIETKANPPVLEIQLDENNQIMQTFENTSMSQNSVSKTTKSDRSNSGSRLREKVQAILNKNKNSIEKKSISHNSN